MGLVNHFGFQVNAKHDIVIKLLLYLICIYITIIFIYCISVAKYNALQLCFSLFLCEWLSVRKMLKKFAKSQLNLR